VDEAEIRWFLERDYARLVNAMAILGDGRPAAEDAVQEALGRAWELSERGGRIDSLPAWVATVSRNLLRDRIRRLLAERRARVRMGGRADDAQPLDVASAERRADVARALASLPRRQREVAVFRYYLDLDVAEIAVALRVPEGTVKSALHRARQSLARALSYDEAEEAADVPH
jgi:RNA polymerase sigma factor (sigma-70 family)